MTSYKIIVCGKVQGVYYRKTIKQNSSKLGFQGYVKNLKNGDVEVGVLLNEDTYDIFMKILKKGSANSRVDKLIVKEIDESFEGFVIR